jgi:rhamnopyranosyl-N-acetylglucosaminyl-diphospho-decaprenol beta-1,3/1,4-galactofuranosyltransferase
MGNDNSAMNIALVVAVIATYRRQGELHRLLAALKKQGRPLYGVVVADNAAEASLQQWMDAETISISNSTKKAVYLSMPENRGCGAGLQAAEKEALQRFPDLTHFWILDDDALPPPDSLEKLLLGLERAEADLICPLLTDEQGQLWGFPEPKRSKGRDRRNKQSNRMDRVAEISPARQFSYSPQKPERLIRQCRTPEEVLEKLGPGPHPMWWCTGACVLVTRRAVDVMGFHRDDYWLLGEDHEFSLRVGSHYNTVFISNLTVPHLPPLALNMLAAEKVHYWKFTSLLQNLSYNGLRLRYSGPMWRYLPGNFKRFFYTFGFSGKTLRHAISAFYYGACCGEAAGGARAERMRESL